MNTIKEIRESSLQKINKAGMLIIAVTIVPVFATLIGVGFYVLLPQLTWTKLIMILGGILFTLIAWLVILYHSSRETSHTQQKLD
jgi:arginine exporter protein ArgO